MQKKQINQRYQRTVNKVALVATPLVLATSAHATIDVSEATTQLALAIAALGALGAAKLAPAALAWVWGLVTRNAQR